MTFQKFHKVNIILYQSLSDNNFNCFYKNNVKNTFCFKIMNFDNILQKLDNYEQQYPLLTQFWKKYLFKKKILLDKAINDCSQVLENIKDFPEINEKLIILLYVSLQLEDSH